MDLPSSPMDIDLMPTFGKQRAAILGAMADNRGRGRVHWGTRHDGVGTLLAISWPS